MRACMHGCACGHVFVRMHACVCICVCARAHKRPPMSVRMNTRKCHAHVLMFVHGRTCRACEYLSAMHMRACGCMLQLHAWHEFVVGTNYLVVVIVVLVALLVFHCLLLSDLFLILPSSFHLCHMPTSYGASRWVGMHVSVRMCMRASARTCEYVHTFMHICLHACTNECMYVCAHKYTHACVRVWHE